MFPDLKAVSRVEQKRRLRRAVEKYRHDAKTIADRRTENNPLCFPASLFAPHNTRTVNTLLKAGAVDRTPHEWLGACLRNLRKKNLVHMILPPVLLACGQ
jgi:hypothetical protein